MRYRTIEIEDTDYQYLEKAAKSAGISIQLFLKQLIAQQLGDNGGSRNDTMAKQTNRQKGRWAQFSERIQKNPPLSGAGELASTAIQTSSVLIGMDSIYQDIAGLNPRFHFENWLTP